MAEIWFATSKLTELMKIMLIVCTLRMNDQQ